MPTEAGIGSFRMRLTMGEPLLAITRSPHPPALRAPSPTGRRVRWGAAINKEEALASPNGRSCQRMLTDEGIDAFRTENPTFPSSGKMGGASLDTNPIPSSARAAGTFSHWEKDYPAPCPYRPTVAITQSRIFQPEACVVSF